MLTIAKLKRWSINYYIDTAKTARRATTDRARAGGGLGEYYSEHDTRTPVWLTAGDTHTAARLVGLTDIQRAGGEADAETVARWLDAGTAPSGAHGRTFGMLEHSFEARVFAPGVGVAEDPVTGSFAAGVAHWFGESGSAPSSYTISQGLRLGRRGVIDVDTDVTNRHWIGGASVTCVTGSVAL